MTSRERLIRVRLGILAVAAELKNVAKACKLGGVSRSQFYAMKKAYEDNGKEGLAPKIRRKPTMPNRTPASLERQILLKTQANPTVSYVRFAEKMRLEGIAVTPSMVRYVWLRHGLSTRQARLRWVKKSNGHAIGMKVQEDPLKASRLKPVAPISATALLPPRSVTGAVSGADLDPLR